ncbi:MAG: PKD domain-containing protein [Candidatus Thalassarchaeaceae archaeon]
MLAIKPRTNSLIPLLLISVLLFSIFSPCIFSEEISEEQKPKFITTDLSEFSPNEEGKEYMFNGDDLSVFSATGFLKNKWVEAGYPELVLPFSENEQSKNSIRSCENAWSVGESDNITTSGGTITATVQRISTNSAIFVENGKIVSSTTLNDIVSTWESTIFPTDTYYFGDPPDVDNNCQIEIVIYEIDGVGGTGGYFQPGISSIRESLFFDIDDMNSRNTILAHEFEHLLHNARDPFEYMWIDEGAADMAAYLCFGATETLSYHANEWAQNSSISVRWWNDRIADYGAGFLFLMYISDKLGGGQAIQRLVADTAVGGTSIENLAINPEPGSTPIGTTMNDIFANFSAAVSLDSPQGAFGFSNLDLTSECGLEEICKAQLSGENDQWINSWQSESESIEGWGMRSYKFSQGNGDPLNLMVLPTQFGFVGSILVKEASTGTWTMSKLRIDSATGVGTGLVHGFGNTTSDVYLFVWYNSLTDDCDYNFVNCGIMSGSYPVTSFTVYADLISEPAEVSIDSINKFDRDGDGFDDSVELGFEIISYAFFEIIEVDFGAYVNNTLKDTLKLEFTAGNGEAEIGIIWFSPPTSGEWTFGVEIFDITGEYQDSAFSLPVNLQNMKPEASGSIATNITQTWTSVNIFGGGYDVWGFGDLNGSFAHNETPTEYIWDLGNGEFSGLKNPTQSYEEEGEYQITLIVRDQGGHYSEIQIWDILVNDTSTPIPVISIEGIEIEEEITILTNQNIKFSALDTIDNVPIEKLNFTWDWGDGDVDSGEGYFEAYHSWIDGDSDGIAYQLTLTVYDGKHYAEYFLQVNIINRIPRQIFEGELQTDTLTPLEMPEIFIDDDGIIVEYEWIFQEGVNISDSGVTLASDFSETKSVKSNPKVSWLEPGIKNISLQVTDDDGNFTIAHFTVEVNNQRPVAIFNRPSDGMTSTAYVFQSSSFDIDGDSSNLIHIWNISDMEESIYDVASISRTFSKPGLYSVSLTVVDDRGLESATKTYYFKIENPLPMPILEFRQPSVNGTILEYIPENTENITWQVPNLEGGGIFIAPNMPIMFDGSQSFDTDSEFYGKESVHPNDPDWNGITKWVWDFGDSSPEVLGPLVWHSYELPGIYLIEFTVLDGFEGGEANSTYLTVHVSSSPDILTTNPIGDEYVTVGDAINLDIVVSDSDLTLGVVAWMDEDASEDSDGDGNMTNDKDVNLADQLTIKWDFNVFEDSNFDGNYRNDWANWENKNWNLPGDSRIAVEVCDGVGVCSSKDFIITVLSTSEDNSPKTLSDLTIDDLIPDKESFGVLSLVAIVLILGWLVMRQKNEDEMDAIDMLETYGVEVKLEGGLPGMDQHTPPPQPKYLTVDERKNKESGYVRPIRTRREK